MGTTKERGRAHMLFGSITRKPTLPDDGRDNRTLHSTIYNPRKGERFGNFRNRFNWVHVTLKYKIFAVPLLVFERSCRNRLAREVPNVPENEALQVFASSFDAALKIWQEQYIDNLDRVRENPDLQPKREDRFERASDDYSVRLLRNARDMVLTVGLTDTAFREFLNIYTHQLGAAYARHYAGKTPNHLFYTAEDIRDTKYFYWWVNKEAAQSSVSPAEKDWREEGEK